MSKSSLQRKFEERQKSQNNATPTSLMTRFKKREAEGLDGKLQRTLSRVSDVRSSWKTQDEISSLKTTVELLKNEVEGKANQYENASQLIDKLKNATNFLDETANLMSGFKNADEYNTAKTNDLYAEKNKGLTTYQQYKDYIASSDYAEKVKSGEITEDEVGWLRNKLYSLASPEDLQAEIDKLEAFLNDHSSAKQKKNSATTSNMNNEFNPQKSIMPNSGEVETANNEYAQYYKKLGFENIEDYEKYVSEKQEELDLLKTIQTKKKNSNEFENKWSAEKEAMEKSEFTTDTTLYDLIKNHLDDKLWFNVTDTQERYVDFKYYKYMTPEENQLAMFLFEQGNGKTLGENKKLQEYLDDLISTELDERYTNAMKQDAFDEAASGGWAGAWASVKSVGYNLLSGPEYLANVITGNSDRRSTFAAEASGFREGTKSNWDGSAGEEVWDFLYDTTMSGADSLAAAGISIALPGAGEVLLGASAAASTANELLDRGVTGGNVVLGSLTAGVLESVFEHISIGKLPSLKAGSFAGLGFTKAGLKRTVKEIGKNVLTNASEEMLTEYANVIADDLINGELSSYAIAVEEYYMQGMSLEEARSKAAKDIGNQVGMAALSGGLMGFGFGAGGSLIGMKSSQIQNSRNGNIIVKDTGKIKTLKTIAANSGFSDIAKAAEKLSENSKPSEVGSVYNSLIARTMEKAVTEMTSDLTENGATKGGSNSASGWANNIIKIALTQKSGKLSPVQGALIRNNSIAGSVYTAFVDEGEYGGETIFALNGLLASPTTKNATQSNSVDGAGKGATAINSQGVEVPTTEDGKPAAGPIETGALRGFVSGKTRDFATVPKTGNLRGIAAAPRSGNIKTIAEAYGERVARNLRRTTPRIENTIKKIGKSFGLDVEFVDDLKGADGEISGNKVLISRYAKNPIKFVFKHELTHSFEKSKLYSEFSEYVTEESEAFKRWLKLNGFETDSEAINETRKRYKEHGEELGYTEAKTEVIADFVGDTLFNDDKGFGDNTIDMDFLSELAKADRNLFERFVEWIESIIARIKAADAVDRDIIKLEQKLKRLKETVDISDVDSTTKKSYNQFRTEALIWANSAGTNVGDRKVFNRNGKEFVLLKATEDGYVELASGSYKELKTLEQQYRKPDNSVYVYSDIVRNAKRGRIADNSTAKNSGQYERSSRSTGNQGFQTDTARNAEHLRRSNRETSKQKADSVDGSASSMPKSKYSYAGIRASTANMLNLDEAKRRLKDGDDPDLIRIETGWFKGMDGKWRFEINDKDMGFTDKSKDFVSKLVDYSKTMNFVMFHPNMTEEQRVKCVKIVRAYEKAKIKEIKLGEFIKHDALFAAYPMLRDCTVKIEEIDETASGSYDPETNILTLDPQMEYFESNLDFKKLIMHEIQHAIQIIEGFAFGSSGVYWAQEFMRGNQPKFSDGRNMTEWDAYQNTAGEIEARDVMKRLEYTDSERDETRPDIDQKDVVFVAKPENHLDGYNEILKQAWKKGKKVVPYEDVSDIERFVDNIIDDPKYRAEMYFGVINKDFETEIKRASGMQTLSLHNSNVVLKASVVRNQLKTSLEGKEIFNEVYETINNADFIRAGSDGKTVLFEKEFGDKTVIVSAVCDENIGNLFIEKVNSTQKTRAKEKVTAGSASNTMLSKGDVKYSIPRDHEYVYQQGKASFTEERLNSLFDEHSLGKGKRAEHSNAFVAYISPDEFLDLTSNGNIRDRVEDEAYILNEEELKNESETPFLEYDPTTGEVTTHEGRHRMVALKADGIESVAVVLKPSTDSFERRIPQDISLIGQNFAGGRAKGNFTVKNAIPLSEKYRTEAVAQFAENPDADIRYSIPRKITPNMSEIERADALRKAGLDIVNHAEPQGSEIDFEYLESSIKSKAEKHLLKKLQALGYLRHYTTKAIDIEFDFTMGGLRKSTHSQLEYGGDYSDFAKVIVNLQQLLDSSVLIESHTDKAKGTPKENNRLKQVYVLLSALNDGKNIIPVQFEIKQFIDDNNRLYLAVALTKIETGVMGNTAFENQTRTNLLPISSISIPELFSKINPKDKKFLKYVPDEFLNLKQKAAKQEALDEDDVKYGRKNTQYSIPAKAKGKTNVELENMIKNGEITLDEALESLADQHGEMPKGEKPKVDVTFPEKISKSKDVRQTVRTIVESGHLTDGMSEDAKMAVIKGALTYEVISDKSAMKKADNAVMTDFEGAVRKWQDIINSGKLMNKYDIALGERLLQQAAENGNASDTMKYIAELSELGTRMGQNIQALHLLKQMTGIGKLYYVQRTVDTLNRDIEQKYKGKKAPVKIDPDLAQMLAEAKNTEETEDIADDMLKDIADQMPSTFLDRWNAWRYLSMLGNPRTHIRNITGNAVFVPAIRIKDGIAYLGERFISKENRTKVLGLLKAEYRDFARNDFDEIKDILTGGGKMNPSDKIRDQQKIFKTKAFEILRKKNSSLMEAEDLLFLRMHYVRALGSALQARNLDINNITPEQLNVVRLYAIKEAQKATYRDASAVAEALNRFQYSESKSVRAFGMLVEGVLPFKKTPINILKRGVEYSPIGLMTSLTKGVIDLKKGNITASDFIDGISAGLTGTGIMILGGFLQSLGIVIGGLDYDDEDALERMSGAQPYSLQIGDVSYTIDWMAPAVLPFLVGAEIEKFIETDEERDPIGFMIDALAAIGEPVTELSMLSGLNDAIESVAYSDNKLTDLLTSAGTSYLSQAVPTIGGQIARTFDDTRRSNFVDKNSPIPKGLQQAYQKAIGKIPGAENTKVPYIDAWGRTEENDNILLRAFENFVSPGYVSTIEDDKINDAIAKVYVETGESGIIPKRAETSIQVDGETKYLNAEEYVQYAASKGQISRQYIEGFTSHPMYSGMDDFSKAEVMKNLYSYANAKAKSEVSDYDYTSVSTYSTAAKLEAIGVDPVSYYIAKAATSTENADKDGSGTVTKAEYKSGLKNSGLSSDMQKKILNARYPKK